MSSSSCGSTRNSSTMVTQMYTFNSWSKKKSSSSGLPYVGFPGLSLTPIQESPLLMDSILNDDQDRGERHRWNSGGSSSCTSGSDLILERDSWNPYDMKNGALPKHWATGCNAPPWLRGGPSSSSSSDPKSEPGGSGISKNGDVEAGLPPLLSSSNSSSPSSETAAGAAPGGGSNASGSKTPAGGSKASESASSSSSASATAPRCVNVHLVQTTTFLPKDEPVTAEQKRAHVCKLLLFALCGFVVVAGIVLWIFSPAFT